MSDISKCEGTDCCYKETCWRYLAPSNPKRQSFIVPLYNVKYGCMNYWRVENDTLHNR